MGTISNFKRKWKTSKKFRTKAILTFVIAVLFFNSYGSDVETQGILPNTYYNFFKTSEDCDQYALDPRACLENNCVYDDQSFWVCKNGLDEGNYVCTSHYLVKEYSTIYPDHMCKEGLVPVPTNEEACLLANPLSSEALKCVTRTQAETAGYTILEPCTGWQAPFAQILDAIWKNNYSMSCNVKAYIVMGFMGLIVLAVL